MAPTVPIDFVGQKESKKFGLSQSMGKSRKFSKGHSSGFVPDYRHGVETMGESDGFGSLGRVETEMTTASGNSYAPKRKCVGLNLVGYESFGVPMQVLSFSNMSKSERKNLELQLKSELEQVRIVQRKIASFSSNTVLLSPHSDIRSCSDGLKRPPLEGLHLPVEPSPLQSKKRVPGVRNGARPKKGSSGHVEAVKPVAQANPSNALLLNQCEDLLNRLRTHQYGWVFNTPVDVVKLNIPDYFTIIKQPMDLGTVQSKITSGEYSSPLAFAADVRLTFANAMKYNPPGNDVHVMADSLHKYFEVRWKNIEKKLTVVANGESMPSSAADGEVDTVMSIQPPKKKKITHSENKVKTQPARQVMTDEHKQKLSEQLVTLLAELPESIIDFLKEQSNDDGRGDEDEIEIDIYALSNDTLFRLRKLLDDYLFEKQKSQAKAELCEMELINVSGLSNSSLQPYKVEEDVDIVGGKDPPVEIQKEAANKNIICSNSSSSSSESGSSSSDSDSGSSSGSEPNAVKASACDTVTKESMAPEDTLDQKGSAVSDLEIGNESIEGVARAEVNFQDKSLVAEADGRPEEEESAPPERQVSPEKMYRAALLRNRFADTILKARAKALEKDEKLDPDKLQKEKEEFERRQKEEKARLQAEAKAAEEAKRKAEAEAAVEAKRKRELEREAARQALQQMEKTVEINENSQFMEDLEMLRTTNDEEVPSFIEETTSPEHNSLNALGSFNLRSNPLEQLGLFMKDDEEEEEIGEREPQQKMGEEGEPLKCAGDPEKDVEDGGKDVEEGQKDVEEGEID